MQCGCMNCCFVVKAPANAIMQHKQRQIGQNYCDMFYKMYCCAAIHGQIWMNNVPNKRRIILLCHHALKSVLLYLFSILRNFESNPGFLFFKLIYVIYIDRSVKNYRNLCQKMFWWCFMLDKLWQNFHIKQSKCSLFFMCLKWNSIYSM